VGRVGCLSGPFVWRDPFQVCFFFFFFTNTNAIRIYNSIFIGAAGYASAYLAYPVPPPLPFRHSPSSSPAGLHGRRSAASPRSPTTTSACRFLFPVLRCTHHFFLARPRRHQCDQSAVRRRPDARDADGGRRAQPHPAPLLLLTLVRAPDLELQRWQRQETDTDVM
jgi:hypothetical protein